jgi:AcrR family transcriptional regulator
MSGLRERKKQQTREAIARAAADLFTERGFESVTVDDVATAAEVARATVFNYFPTKEAMLFDRDAEAEAAIVAAIRDRSPGTSLVDAFRGHTREFWTRLAGVLEHGPLPHGFWEIVQQSPSLRDAAEAMFARHARAAAGEIARELGRPDDDPVADAIARALCGANVSVLVYGLDRLVAGDPPRRVIRDALSAADRAYDLLERGVTTA